MSIFEGAGVALVTPMKADGSIDFDNLRKWWSFRLKVPMPCSLRHYRRSVCHDP